MNFHSHTSFNYKLNNIRTLVHRAYTLCSSWVSIDLELRFLINYFKDNAYPENIIFKIINKFLITQYETKTKTNPIQVEKMVIYQKIPYINDICSSFIKKELQKTIERFYPQIDLKTVFFNAFTVQSLLSHKEKLPSALCSGVCYNYKCGACGATYVGSTIKCLRSRVEEHFGRSSRTGSLLARPLQSKVREHIFNCTVGYKTDDFTVLSSFSDNILLRIAESIEISFRKPNLNCDSSSFPLFLL